MTDLITSLKAEAWWFGFSAVQVLQREQWKYSSASGYDQSRWLCVGGGGGQSDESHSKLLSSLMNYFGKWSHVHSLGALFSAQPFPSFFLRFPEFDFVHSVVMVTRWMCIHPITYTQEHVTVQANLHQHFIVCAHTVGEISLSFPAKGSGRHWGAQGQDVQLEHWRRVVDEQGSKGVATEDEAHWGRGVAESLEGSTGQETERFYSKEERSKDPPEMCDQPS